MNNSLAEVHPELVSEWSEKNLTLTPDDITFGSNKKVWWRGACGHEWQASVKARSNGEKCPICSGARVIAGINDLATLEPLLVKQWSKKNKIKPTEVSIGSHKKVIWRCEKGHEWEAVVKSRTINKTGCPYCSHNKVLAGFNDLATLLPDIAAEWSDRNYPLLPTQVTVFANRKAWWKCKDCGREWNTLISTRSGGSKCPYCSGYIFLKGFNDLQTTHPEIASEWSEKNLPLKPDEVNAKSRKNVWWRCGKCGNEWKSVINARVKGTVCPVCAEREVLAGYNDLVTTDNQLLSEWDYEQNKLKPTEVSRTSAKRAWWKCRHGHSWSMKINERTILKKGCRICEQEYLSLFPALAVSYYSNKKGLKAELGSDRLLGVPLETYIPSEKLAIESGSADENIEIMKAYMCEQRGIRLIKLPMKGTELDYADSLKRAFQNVHIFISSDTEEDVEIIKNATAVLEIEQWNKIFGRWVNRGARGIAVFADENRSRQRLTHYFDISDTHESRYSRTVPIWDMRQEYEADVIETLESTFGEIENKSSLAEAIMGAARNAAEDNIPDYLQDLYYATEGSSFEEVEEDIVASIYKNVVANSVAYMMMSRLERQRAILEQQLEEITGGIAELKRNRGENFSIKQLEKSKKSIKQKLDKLNDQTKKDDVVTFEELGVDRLFVDESHYYKNLYLYTKMRNVGGIAQTEAQKSSDLFMKCRYLDEITGGRGTVFATGTPISNSMVELYTIQRYLQYNTLVKNGLQHFDAWASTFGETITAVELTPEGTGYRAKTRFAKFYNLPELMAMFKEIADIKTADMLNLPVPEAKYHNIAVKPSEMQKEMVASLAERAEQVRGGGVDSSVDNMLKITNDGRKLALDQRMLNDMLPDFEGSKINACVDNIYRIWKENADKKSAQLVFCDLSTPKNDGTFSVYNDIRKKLIERGIPESEVKFIHEADTDMKKKELFQKTRKGEVRVLLGSTQKMGAGTNVQDKLIALHDVDCPWRPSDLEQRSGRIVRQGNENPQVDIYRYVTEQTFDAYLYQLVEGKQKFASQIMTSKSPVRSAEDIDETALSYAEIKMLATGNPYIKEKMDLDIQVQKLKMLKSNFLSEKYGLEDKVIKFYPQQIAYLKSRVEGLTKDVETAKLHPKPIDEQPLGMMVSGVSYSEKAEAGQAIINTCKSMNSPDAIPLGEYRSTNKRRIMGDCSGSKKDYSFRLGNAFL